MWCRKQYPEAPEAGAAVASRIPKVKVDLRMNISPWGGISMDQKTAVSYSCAISKNDTTQIIFRGFAAKYLLQLDIGH